MTSCLSIQKTHSHMNILFPAPLELSQPYASIVLFHNRSSVGKDGLDNSSKMAQLTAGISRLRETKDPSPGEDATIRSVYGSGSSFTHIVTRKSRQQSMVMFPGRESTTSISPTVRTIGLNLIGMECM
jgi:hypothetical protein